MFINSIKEINKLRPEIIWLLSNVFNSIKKINRLRKKINRLWCKGTPNTYLKVTITTFSKLRIF